MRCSRNLAVPMMVLVAGMVCSTARAQTPDFNGIGRAAKDEEIKAWDIAIGVEGKELPHGSGTAKQGAEIFAKKCAACHGQNLEGVQFGARGPDRMALAPGKNSMKTIGTFWPFATTVWDYIHRAMPWDQEGSLTPDEVYSVTALIFFRTGIIKENDVLDEKTLPKVQMPNRKTFFPQRFEDIADLEKRGCRLGQCP